MKKITLGDILPRNPYEVSRSQHRRRIISIKEKRRLAVGEKVSFLFEDRDTVWFQIQEILRLREAADSQAVQAVIDEYNPLIPEENQLSATMFIELTQYSQVREELAKLMGIDREVYLELGDDFKVRAHGEDHAEEHVSAIYFLKFDLTPDQVQALLGRADSFLTLDHPHYRASTRIPDELREELKKGLTSP